MTGRRGLALAPAGPPQVGAAWLDGMGLAALRREFAVLPPATDLTGTWAERAVGPWWLRAAAPYALAVIGLHGWFGKQFHPDGSGEVLVWQDGAAVPRAPLIARRGVSEQDGRPALVLSYTSGPLRLVRDEIRQLDRDLVLGLSRVDLPLLRALSFPFAMRRTQAIT